MYPPLVFKNCLRSKLNYKNKKIKVAAVDIGGSMPASRFKFIESALLAAKRNEVIKDIHVHDGAVIGAVREAMIK